MKNSRLLKLDLIRHTLVKDVNALFSSIIFYLLYSNNNSPLFLIPLIICSCLFAKRMGKYLFNAKKFHFLYPLLLISYLLLLPFIFLVFNSIFCGEIAFDNLFFMEVKKQNFFNDEISENEHSKDNINHFLINGFYETKYLLNK